MSNRFIITEYRKWSKFKNPDFNQVYEVDAIGATGAAAATAAPAEAPELSEDSFSNDTTGDKPAMFLWVPQGTAAALPAGVMIEVANVANFSPVKATYQLTYPITTTENIEPTGSTLGWSIVNNSFYYRFPSTPDTQYYVRMYYTNSKGKGPVSDTLTVRSYKAGYNPDSKIPVGIQTDPDVGTAYQAAIDRNQNWIPYKDKESGNYEIIYGELSADKITGDPLWEFSLASDETKSSTGRVSPAATVDEVMSQDGGFKGDTNIGNCYSQALGGKVFKLWVCVDTDLIY
jgi:hypothetical protein